METIKDVLMSRDGMTEHEAEQAVSQAREEMLEAIGEGDMDEAYYICDQFGLEPDYLEDLLY
jgi:hypothetical protein